jgi:MFS transporter, AAHS family, 3-hydroxyphenylpropionic acid transporter
VGDGARRLLALLGLAIVFEGYGRSLPSVALATIGADLGVGSSALSFALALTACGALGVVLLGWLGDRFGRRTLLLAAVAGYAILGAATASARTLAALVVWQAAARMFQDGALTGAAVIAAEEMPPERRGAAQGMLGLMNQLGAGFASLCLAGIDAVPGRWRGLMLLNIAPLVFLPVLARALPESRRWSRQAHAARSRLPARYRGRLLAGLVLAFLAMSYDVAGFAFTAYVPMTEHGWSPAAVSAMLIIAGGIGLPGWWIGGTLADRVGRRPCMIVFLVGLTLAEVAFFRLGAAALWPAFGAMVFCQAGKTAVLRAWSTELFPTAWRATTAAWLAAAATLGGITGLALAGTLAPHLGGIAPALTLVAAAGLLAACACAFLPETRGLDLDTIAPDG